MSSEGTVQKGKPVGAVRQAVALLRVLSRSDGPLGVNEAARRAGVNPSTAFNVLRTLVDEDLVVLDGATKRYAIGLGLLQLAGSHEARDLIDMLTPELVRIATNYECLVALWRFTPDERAVLLRRAHADTLIRLDIQVTERIPCLIGSVGRAFAATRDWPERDLRSRFSTLRWANPLPFEGYLAEVREARRRGYGRDVDQLYAGISSVGAVIVDRSGTPFLGFSAIMLTGSKAAASLDDAGAELAALTARMNGTLSLAA